MLPLIYDMITHVLTLAERRDVNTPLIIMQAVSLQLRKFNEKRGMNTGETTLYAAVLDLLANLSFPIPGGANPMVQGGGGPIPMVQGGGPNQVGSFMQPQMQQMNPNMNPMDMPPQGGPPPHMMQNQGVMPNQMGNMGMNMGGGPNE
jgi:hypothetical protein